MAAATVTRSENAVFTVVIDDTDWVWTDTFTDNAYSKGIRIWSIVFQPGNAADKISIKNGSASGPIIFPDNALLTTDPQIQYYGGNIMKPVIDYSECTLNSGHKVIITIANGSLTR